MNDLLQVLAAVTTWLEEQGIDYMIFGGLANAIYGNPRQTYVIDIKIKLDQDKLDEFITQISALTELLPANAKQFIEDTNVLPVRMNDVRIDIVIASLPFEINAIARSTKVSYQNITFNTCTLEDFIIQKAVSTRERDWGDINTVMALNKNKLNWNYLVGNCQELSKFLDRPDIINRIKRFKNEA